MKVEEIKSCFLNHKETSLYGRYITNDHIGSLLKKISTQVVVETVGRSVLKNPIYGVKIGKGDKRILMWSQMHGNESTTTKAIFDLLNTFLDKNTTLEYILEACTLYFIPILNPDGAKAYTRINANKVDLNRDAQELTQPESNVLRDVFKRFNPHFCYNLHGQRTIFSAGASNKPATVSFLSPAQDKACTITSNRKIAMEVIGVMNNVLQRLIPGHVGVYDDAFNINCVGDTFQSENVPTILFEAGHYYNDYNRERTREYIFVSLVESLDYISKNTIEGINYEPYLEIPENDKCFYDIIIRNTKNGDKGEGADIGILYQEKLINDAVAFVPKTDRVEDLSAYYGHKEFDANGLRVCDEEGLLVKVGSENVFVILNNEKTSLLIK